MNNQQTAMEWFEEEYMKGNVILPILFQQAKQMEKQQIMDAVYDSMGTNFDPNYGRAELYYNEKYGK